MPGKIHDVHVTVIFQCFAHTPERYPAGMFYYTCDDCGVHSQCWGTRKVAREMARDHHENTPVPLVVNYVKAN
jgi:hypothetical protein